MIPLTRISEIASAKGRTPAIILEDGVVSWSDFHERTGRFVTALQSMSRIQRLDSICFVSPNCAELVYLMAAAASLKISVFGLDYTQPQETLRTLMLKAGADAVVVSSRALLDLGLDPEGLTSARPAIDLDECLPHALRVSDCVPAEADDIVPAPRPFRAVGFTSGTSGLPKIVLRTTSFDARRFGYFTARYGFASSDRHLVTIPLYHAAGNGWARLFLNLGATLVLPPHGRPEVAARMMASEGVTTSAMTPPIAVAICKAIEASQRPLAPGCLRFVLVGGKNFSAVDKAFCARMLHNSIYEYYGTTETGVNTIAEPDDILRRADTVGRAYDGNDIAVLGPDDRPLGTGQVGRIAIHSYMNMSHYAEGEVRAVEIGGKRFIVTNELGALDGEGYLTLRNRDAEAVAADLYTVENAIKELPCVADAAVVPSGTGRRPSVACGFVLRPDAAGTPEAVARRVRGILKAASIRRVQLSPISTVPYSPSGKVLAPALKDLVARSLPPKPRRGVGFLVGVAMLASTATAWGGMFHIAKSALTEIDAFHVTLVRYGLAALIFMALLFVREGSGAFRVGRDILKLWWLGTLGFAGFSILAFWGLSSTRPEHGAIIMALMPLITVTVLFFKTGARINRVTLGCIVVALSGVVAVITNGNPIALVGGALVPNLAILVGAACWVIYTLGARAFPSYSVLRYTAISAGLGAVSIAALTEVGILAGLLESPSLGVLSEHGFALGYLVLVAGVMAVFSWNAGIRILGPVNGVLFINLVPIAALTFGHLKGHAFSGIELAGSALTIAALIANNLNDRGLLRLPASVSRADTPRAAI